MNMKQRKILFLFSFGLLINVVAVGLTLYWLSWKLLVVLFLFSWARRIQESI